MCNMKRHVWYIYTVHTDSFNWLLFVLLGTVGLFWVLLWANIHNVVFQLTTEFSATQTQRQNNAGEDKMGQGQEGRRVQTVNLRTVSNLLGLL